MPIHSDGQAPYGPPAAVLSVITGYRERGLATPFDLSVLERAGVPPSVAPRTLQSLRLLGLIDDEGNPTPALSELGTVPTDEFSQRLAAVLRGVYEEVFQFTDPGDDPPQKVRDAFRVYKPRGQQDRMVTLFMGLCAAAGIVDDAAVHKRMPTSAGTTKPRANGPVKKSQRGRTKPKGGEEEAQVEFSPAPNPATGQHPFIRGLIQMLPDVGATWPTAKRNAWTRAALAAFDVLYELPADDHGGGDRD